MTNRQVERATNTLRDDKVPGLVLYVGKRSKRFYLYRRLEGRPRKIKLGNFPGMKVEQARKKALAVIAEIENGTYGKPTSFGELWELFREVKAAKRSIDQDEFNYDLYLSHWSRRRLNSITVGDCQRLHAGMSKTPYLANRVRALLSTMFNEAVKHGLVRDNPVRAVAKFPEQSRERFLNADELPRFFTALQEFDQDFRDFVLLCLYTGVRSGNVLGMRWEQVDGNTWTIPRTKNGRPQRVYLCKEALAVLDGRVRDDDWYVLPMRSSPRRKWERLCRNAGLRDLRIHDLRRTLGSWQAATGASLPIIGKTLGHLSSNVTQIYARLDLSPVQQAVDTAVEAMTGWYMVVSEDDSQTLQANDAEDAQRKYVSEHPKAKIVQVLGA